MTENNVNYITKTEIQDRLKELGAKPSDIYDDEILLKDPFVSNYIEAEREKARKKREEENDNPLIPGDDEPTNGNNDIDNSLIPD